MAEEQTYDDDISLPFDIQEEDIVPDHNQPEEELPLEEGQPPSEIPYEVEGDTIQPSTVEQEYLSNTASRNDYESSSAFYEDGDKDYQDEVNRKLQAEEEEKIKSGDRSGWVNFGDDLITQSIHGTLRGVSETGETFGAPEGWLEKTIVTKYRPIPEPETTRQQLLQGFSQYGSQFFPLNMAFQRGAQTVQLGSKLASLFKRSKPLLKTQRYLAAMSAGAVTDMIAFDYTDPNAVNFLMSVTSISEHSATGAFLNKWLAQNPEDSELWARGKAAFTGALTGALLDSFFRLLGFGYKMSKAQLQKRRELLADANIDETRDILGKDLQEQFKEETGVTVEEFEEAVEEMAFDIGESMDSTVASLNLKQRQDLSQGLPNDVEQGVISEANRRLNDAIAPLANTLNEPNEELVNLLTKIANGDELSPEEFFFIDKNGKRKPIIESFNLNKLKTSDEIKGQIQAISRVIDAKKLKRTTFNENITDLVALLGKPKEEIIEALKRNVGSIEQAIEWVPAYKVMVHIAVEQSNEAFTRLAQAIPGSKNYKQLTKIARAQAANLQEMVGLASKESAASGRLLQAHKNAADPNADAVLQAKSDLLSHLFDNADVGKVAARVSRLKTVSDSRLAEFKVNIAGSKRTVKVDPKQSRRARKTASQAEKTEAAIKRLEKRLLDIQEGRIPSKKTPREKTARELELEDAIAEELEKLKLPPEQIALRKKHLKLSNRIKKLKEERDKATGDKEAGVKTTEIHELEAEVKKLTKRFKKPKTDAEKSEAKLKKLREELDQLVLIKKDDKTALDEFLKTTKKSRGTPDEGFKAVEKELKKEIENQKKRLGILKSKRITEEDLRELALATARKEETDAINNANLTQLRNMIKASQLKGWVGGLIKTKDVALEIYINGLLSSFKTAGINAFGNTYAIGSSVIERFMAARKGGGPIGYKEATILAYNALAGIPEAWKLFRVALKHGPAPGSSVKTDFFKQYDRSISKELFRVNGNLGRSIDFIGGVINLPGRVVMAMDEAYKALTYRMEFSALSYRKAATEFGKTPKTVDEIANVQRRANQILQEVESGKHEEILAEASRRARENTYTQKLADVDTRNVMGKKIPVSGLSQLVKNMIERDPTGMLRVFLPFFQTPVNLMSHSFQRMPGLQYASKLLRDELKSPDPAVRQLAEAKISTGRWIYGGAFLLGWNGQITGGPPADPQLRRQMEDAMGGKHWHSFNLGFGWQPYNRLDPIGMILATSADLAQMGKGLVHLNHQHEAGADDDLLFKKFNELAEASSLNITRLITDRHYLQGLTDFMGIFSADLHEQRRWLKRVASVNPVVSLFSSFRRSVTGGYEGSKMEKSQPTVPSERPDEYYYQYKDGKPVLDEKGEKVLKPESELVPKTAFEQIAYQATGEILRLVGDGMREVTPGYGTRRASKTIMGHTKAHPATIYSDRLNLDPYKVTVNLVNNMLNPVPALKTSGDPVELKLAELESRIKSPSQIYSIPLGNQKGTNISYGVLMLNDEQKYYLQDKWIELNTAGGISSMVKGWNKQEAAKQKWIANKMKDYPDLMKLAKHPLMDLTFNTKKTRKERYSTLRELAEQYPGKSAPSPQIQRNTLERFLKINLSMAQTETLGAFPDLMSRKVHIMTTKTVGLPNPTMPTTGLMNNLIPQTTNISPQQQ